MSQRYDLEPAMVLHQRHYRESSSIIELFTENQGRVSVIAKGCRRPKARQRGLLQPFMPLLVSFVGRGELMTLTAVEAQGLSIHLRAEKLFSALYLNEILLYLLHKFDPYPVLYHCYQKTIAQLQVCEDTQPALRTFEKNLLYAIGYGITFEVDYQNGLPVQADRQYYFAPEYGFTQLDKLQSNVSSAHVFLGADLLAIAKEDWSCSETLQAAKRVMRLAILVLLGDRKIKTRALFIKQDKVE